MYVLLQLFTGLSYAAFTALKLGNGLFEMFLRKIRPKYIEEHQFCIRNLPKEKIGDALLS